MASFDNLRKGAVLDFLAVVFAITAVGFGLGLAGFIYGTSTLRAAQADAKERCITEIVPQVNS